MDNSTGLELEVDGESQNITNLDTKEEKFEAKMSETPPEITKGTITAITDKRLRWPKLNLMDVKFTDYLKKSTGRFSKT